MTASNSRGILNRTQISTARRLWREITLEGLSAASSRNAISHLTRDDPVPIRKKVESTQAYKSLFKLLKTDPMTSQHFDKPIFTSLGPQLLTPFEVITFPLQVLLQRSVDRFAFVEAIFWKTIAGLLDFVKNDTIRFRHFLPIVGFTCDIDEFA